MMMRKLIVVCCILATVCIAQDLTKLHISGKPELLTGELIDKSIRDKNGEVCAGIIVLTDLTGFSYNSSNGIVKINQSTGKDFIFLSPDERTLEIFCRGFEPMKIVLNDTGIRLKSGDVWQIKVTGTKTGSLTRADENLFDVIFQLNQESVYIWYGELTPVLSKDMIVTYKLPKGNYTFHFQKSGYKAEERVVNVDRNITETISLSQGSSNINSQLKLPGIVVITSEPQEAEVILNGLKLGNTIFQGELQPGNYEMELRKAYYQSDLSSFTLEPGKTITINRKLIPKFGFINVNSAVVGSKVILDGKQIGNVPIENYQVESSTHTIKIESDLYHPYTEEFVIKDGEQKTINASLKPAFGSIEITSLPEGGADIFIDGNKTGQTPLFKDKIASGKYLLRMTKELFRDYEEQIIIKDGEKLTKNISLSKNFGEFTVIADMSEILLNGKSIGSNKVTQKLNAGKYTLSAVRGEKYYKAEQELFLAIGDKKEITLTPQPKMGGLSLFVESSDASNADIFINDELKGSAPLVLPLLIGDYKVTAKKSNYLDVTEQFSIVENEQKKLTLSMLTYEGSRLQTANKWGTVKWISFIGAALSGGASYYFKTTADKNFDNYKSATLTSDILNYRKLTDDNKKLSDYFLYAATAALSSAIITWIIQVAQ